MTAMGTGRIAGIDRPVSRLILGADNQVSVEQARIFDEWLEVGGNALDTGYVYAAGRCEATVGEWLERQGTRDDVVLIGKGAHTPHCTPEGMRRQLGESLERLRTDHVDLYLLHRDDPSVPVAEFVDALDEERRAGRLRAFGGSNWTPERIDEANAYAASRGIEGFVALSNNLSLARAVDVPWPGCLALADDESRAWAAASGLAILPWSSQGRGFFTDIPANEEIVRCWHREDNFERKARAAELAAARGVHPINVALAWVLHQPFPCFALIGPRTSDELQAALAGLTVELSDDEVAWLDLRS